MDCVAFRVCANFLRQGRKEWSNEKAGAKSGAIAFTKPGSASSGTSGKPRAEAARAERETRVELAKNPPLPPTALSSVVAAYLIESAERGRSMWRLDGLRLSMKNHILPFFGEATSIAAITSERVEKFITALKRKGLKGKSVKIL